MRAGRASELEGSLEALAGLGLNYDPATVGGPGWHHDHVRHDLAREAPGDPVADGPWERACRLVRDYEFVPPTIIRGYFRGHAPLEGRDMLLVGRFAMLRFPMGVRVDAVVDETRTGPGGRRERAWGWSYRTLEHHLERGRLVYEVVKGLDDGRVELVLTGVSQQGAIGNRVIRAGFDVFGRPMQRLFYQAAGRRLAALLAEYPAGRELPAPEPVGGDDAVDLVTAPTHNLAASRFARLRSRASSRARRGR